MSVRVSDALSPQGGAVGPFEYSGSLFIVAATFLAEDASDRTTIGIYKSTDSGETWAQVGTELTLPSSDDSGDWASPVNDSDNIAACVDIADATLVYILHANLDYDLQVDVLDLSAEDWTDTSAAGPNLFPSITPTTLGSGRVQWAIEQSTEGVFGILANLWSDDVLTTGTVPFALSLSSDLGTWSSRDELTLGDAGSYDVAGVARGTSGRVHGWAMRDNAEMYHVLVVGGGGGLGTEFTSVTDGDWIFQSMTCGAADDSGNIGFLFAKEAAGIGTPYRLGFARAASADDPTFTITEVDTVTQASNSYGASLIGGEAFIAVWNRGGSDSFIRQATYTSGWSSIRTPEGDLGPYDFSSSRVSGGIGTLFSQGVSELYYLAPPGADAEPPIPSAYSQWNTSGRYGPWSYGGALYMAAFANVADDQLNDATFEGTIHVLKSEDDGATWTPLALDLPTTQDPTDSGLGYAGFHFGTCVDVAFPSSPYVYIAYVDTAQLTQVVRLNLDTETFDVTSADGPAQTAFSDGLGNSITEEFRLLIEQNSAGDFGLLYFHSFGLGAAGDDDGKAVAVKLSGDLATWDSPVVVAYGDAADLVTPIALMRGRSGRLHGILQVRRTDNIGGGDYEAVCRIEHTLVLDSSGDLDAGTLTLIDEYTETSASSGVAYPDWAVRNDGNVAACAYDSDEKLMFLAGFPTDGSTTSDKQLVSWHADEGATPSWTMTTVEDAADVLWFDATLVPLSDVPNVAYSTTEGGGVLSAVGWTRSFDGSAWSSTTALSFSFVRPAAVETAGKIGLFFVSAGVVPEGGADPIPGDQFSYALSYFLADGSGGGGGGGGQTITGVTTFGGFVFLSPGYVFLGGGCGTLPTAPGCSGGDPMTEDCSLQGFSI